MNTRCVNFINISARLFDFQQPNLTIESMTSMKALPSLLAIALAFGSTLALAQQTAASPASAPAPQPWTHKTKNLNRAEVDALFGNPKKLLVIDVRRPDELTKYGTFPVVLNLQLKDLPEVLDYIPRDRTILTVSNRAHRAGDAGDLLISKGYKVAGATGTEDYREAGGTIVKIAVPAPRTAASAPAPAASN